MFHILSINKIQQVLLSSDMNTKSVVSGVVGRPASLVGGGYDDEGESMKVLSFQCSAESSVVVLGQ